MVPESAVHSLIPRNMSFQHSAKTRWPCHRIKMAEDFRTKMCITVLLLSGQYSSELASVR